MEPKAIGMMARIYRLLGEIKEFGSCKQKECPVKAWQEAKLER